MRTFDSFNFDSQIVQNLEKLAFVETTPIQAEAIPPLMEGRDIIGQARTGSGKTAAYGLPMMEHLKEGGSTPRSLVLCPTRELALQVTDALRSFAKGLPIRMVAIYGGAPYPPQLKALRNGVAVVVGTPGRVIDHMKRGSLDLSAVELLVLDEADEMLRMGFMEDVETVMEQVPDTRQIALFSATMPKPIERVAKRFLNDPAVVKVEGQALSVDHIDQRWVRVPQRHKVESLLKVLQGEPRGATLIFCRTRVGCAETAGMLVSRGLSADSIHGDLNQAARERVLNRFRSQQLEILVATDVAARGLDVSHITHVINLDYPNDAETYVHRIGRTGRAGAKGMAITFVTPGQQRKLHFLKKDTRATIEQMRVPSARDVALLQRDKLLKMMETRLEDDPLLDARTWLTEVWNDSPLKAEDVAAVAVQMLADRLGLSLEVSDEPEEQSFQRVPHSRDQMNETQLFIGAGTRIGVRPGDIVGALANDFNLSGSQIGRIRVLDHKTFVGMTKEVAAHILSQGETVEIRGKVAKISLSTAEQSPDTGGSSPPKKRPFQNRKSFKAKGDYPSKGSFKKKGFGPKKARHKRRKN